ncbi:hypothetical protein OH76DRAFT_6644 [Lentinus brumalis]|uniref:Uncharacterized protein n=1 Tax=Lentinus brumalis TaxID=2498619 RepID=A0A371DWS4_9APHY|nr:hypothetical protein OH76DRAFT_6644 [Polyporus brumalis]
MMTALRLPSLAMQLHSLPMSHYLSSLGPPACASVPALHRDNTKATSQRSNIRPYALQSHEKSEDEPHVGCALSSSSSSPPGRRPHCCTRPRPAVPILLCPIAYRSTALSTSQRYRPGTPS